MTATASATSMDSDYCRKVRERAAADASLLASPRLTVQALRLPVTGALDTELGIGARYQARLQLSASLIDFYRSFRVRYAADADCEQHEAEQRIEELLLLGPDVGRPGALRKRVAFLEEQRDAWRKIVQGEEERFDKRLVSLVEVGDVRRQTDDLDRSLLHALAELARLDSIGAEPHDDARDLKHDSKTETPPTPLSPPSPPTPPSIDQLAERHRNAVMGFEREVSHVRSLDAWDANVLFGVTPLYGLVDGAGSTPSIPAVDWFGMLQLSFKPGLFFHRKHEAASLAAREAELRRARYEPTSALRRLVDLARTNRDLARRELELVERQLATLGDTRKIVESANAASTPHVLAQLSLQQITLGADRAYLAAWIDELKALTTMEEDRGF